MQEIPASWVFIQAQDENCTFHIPNNELVVKWFLLYQSMGDDCSSNCVSSKRGMKCGLEFHKTDGNASPHNKQRSCEIAA